MTSDSSLANTRVLAVVGPTAVGKTALAEELAVRLDGEIVSADSMQVYRGMDIGTAKPGPAERATIPHHLIDVADPWEPFNAARFVELADRAVNEDAQEHYESGKERSDHDRVPEEDAGLARLYECSDSLKRKIDAKDAIRNALPAVTPETFRSVCDRRIIGKVGGPVPGADLGTVSPAHRTQDRGRDLDDAFVRLFGGLRTPEDHAPLIIDYDAVDGERILNLVDNTLNIPVVPFHHGSSYAPLDHPGQSPQVLLRCSYGIGPHGADIEKGVGPDDGPENHD